MNMRNKPCPCNSGKKYKRCCGDEAMLNAKRREADARQLEIVRARAEEPEREQTRPTTPTRSHSMMVMAMLAGVALAGGGGGEIWRRTK